MGIYLDNNATTRPYPEVVNIVTQGMSDLYPNPFTPYSIGKKVQKQMEISRRNIKKMLGIQQKETLVFTSSATESNNLVIRGRVKKFPSSCPHVILSAIEHSSVFQTCQDLERSKQCSFSMIPTDCYGRIIMTKLSEEICRHKDKLAMICIILANNEIGVLQDIHTLIKKCKGYFLHIDATQYIGKYPIQISSLGVQSMTFGSHKFHGPRMGALYLQDKNNIKNPCCTGGRSEQGLRAGTPNVAYIMGMEKALALSLDNLEMKQQHTQKLRDYLQHTLLKIPHVKINCVNVPRLYNTLSVVLPIHGKSHSLVSFLDQHSVYVNVGSACNQRLKSRVLQAIQLSLAEQKSTLRISLSHQNTKKECQRFLALLQKFLTSYNEK